MKLSIKEIKSINANAEYERLNAKIMEIEPSIKSFISTLIEDVDNPEFWKTHSWPLYIDPKELRESCNRFLSLNNLCKIYNEHLHPYGLHLILENNRNYLSLGVYSQYKLVKKRWYHLK